MRLRQLKRDTQPPCHNDNMLIPLEIFFMLTASRRYFLHSTRVDRKCGVSSRGSPKLRRQSSVSHRLNTVGAFSTSEIYGAGGRRAAPDYAGCSRFLHLVPGRPSRPAGHFPEPPGALRLYCADANHRRVPCGLLVLRLPARQRRFRGVRAEGATSAHAADLCGRRRRRLAAADIAPTVRSRTPHAGPSTAPTAAAADAVLLRLRRI